MQLKWDHRFQAPTTTDPSFPFVDVGPTPDGPMASAPENRPHDYRGAMQRYSSVFPVGGASPSLVNNDLVAGATHSHNQTPLVQATCAKCKASLGALLNSWIPVTNTYYLQSQTSYRATGLEVKGEPKPPGNADSALSGCLIQALMCTTGTCREVLAFICAQAPENKSTFRSRQFFKLSKILLTSPTTKKTVEPNIEKANLGTMTGVHDMRPVSLQHQMSDNTYAGNISPGLDNFSDEFTDADKVAVQGTNDGSMTWKEAHEDWSVKTQRTMSPGAFGKRILNFGGGLRPKPPGHPSNDRPMQATNPSNTPNGFSQHRTTAQQAQQAQTTIKTPQHQHQVPPQQQQKQQQQQQHQQHSQHLTQQHSQHYTQQQQQPQHQPQSNGPIQSYRSGAVQQATLTPFGIQQFDSLEQHRRDIDRIDGAVAQMQISVEVLTRSMEVIKKELQKRETSGPTIEDPSALEMLSETVSNMATKTGEVDGIKIQLEALKRRTKRLEDVGGLLPQVDMSHSSNQGHAQSVMIHNKRPAVPQFTDAPGQSFKRQRLSDVDLQIADSAGSTPATTYPSAAYNTSNGESQDTWHPHSQRPLHARGTPTTPGRRGPGRPRKYPTPDLGTPVWEQEGWTPHTDADGYYHAMGQTPTTDERGRIIRRGSLGGSIHMSGKRTRQRPIRNSEGVLIRKDGKPDQRSISSAQNLKKFYNKKIAQLEMEKADSSQVGGDDDGAGGDEGDGAKVGSVEGGTPNDRNTSQDPMVVDVDSEAEGEDYDDDDSSDNDADGDADGDANDAPVHGQGNTDHGAIMKKMFPNGITGETTRLDQVAADLFEPAKSQVAPLARMQAREEAVKKEVTEGVAGSVSTAIMGGGGGIGGGTGVGDGAIGAVKQTIIPDSQQMSNASVDLPFG